jgi:demethylmenaquinone methyltransferase/2-methoxy-6-polyprenyl-1,4-benzoquinol methylase
MPGAGRPALPAADEKPRHVRAMFDRIAPRYDALNRVLSLGLDRGWRKLALDAIAVGPADRVLDLACGTGDLARLAAARGARVVGADFSREMLRGAQARGLPCGLVQADAAALPFRDGSITAAACGFALRNFASLEAVLAELARVLAPHARVALLDVDRPRSAWLRRGHGVWFDRVVPTVGGWLSDRDAYAYLPQSTAYLPEERELAALLAASGFAASRRRRLALGAAQLWTARRAGPDPA